MGGRTMRQLLDSFYYDSATEGGEEILIELCGMGGTAAAPYTTSAYTRCRRGPVPIQVVTGSNPSSVSCLDQLELPPDALQLTQATGIASYYLSSAGGAFSKSFRSL